MPFSLNGCGTRYYGRRYEAPAGSYVTTEWLCFVYIPLVPIASYRVLPVTGGYNYIVSRSQNFLASKVPLCKEQVGKVYLVAAPFMAILGAAFYFR